jgi:hypothetical protein
MKKGDKVKLIHANGSEDWFKDATIIQVNKAKKGKEQTYNIESQFGTMENVPELELKLLKVK